MEGCVYNDADGSRARRGRERLRTTLTTPGTIECTCPKCTDRNTPFTAAEAEHALRHVTDRQAVLYGLNAIDMGGHSECDNCYGWVPSFHAVGNVSPAAVVEVGWCPFHPGGVAMPGDTGWRPRHPLDRPPQPGDAGPPVGDDGEPWSNI